MPTKKIESKNYNWKLLPKQELVEAFLDQNVKNKILGGVVDKELEYVFLIGGNQILMTLPFSYFNESGDGIKPDFGKFKVIDYGYTVSFGDYEASSNVILDNFKNPDKIIKNAIFNSKI